MAYADKAAFAELIRQDRETRENQNWRGSFLDYLELVKQSPSLPELAHGRLYNCIVQRGVGDINNNGNGRLRRLFGDEPVKSYEFFADEFFGIEKVVAHIVRYLHSASLKGEESRQVLYLMGPVGSGKSSLVEKLQHGLEDSQPVYVIEGCPMMEEPLHLLPRHLRREFEKMLGVHIEGDLCPVCRFRLKEEFNERYEEVPIVTSSFSKRNRRGIGVVPPVDPNNQDTSVLIGSEDISKLDVYSEGDPRVLDLNGALNVGNRGMVEFIEVFKNETEYLHAMITATQEKVIPAPGRHGMVYVDTVIVAHSNEAEWQKFKADHTNEAILDRIVVVKVPYNLRLSEEVKIYQKIIQHSDFRAHVAPHTLETASMFAILSRLEATSKCDLLTKLKIYNGEEVVEKGKTKKIEAYELQEDAKREGMSGISTRFIMKALDNALSDNGGSLRRPAQALSRLAAGRPAQGVSRDPGEGDHQGVRVLLSGAGRVAVPELSRPRRSVREQDQGPRSQHQGGTAAGRGLPEVDRGADRHHRNRRRGLPPGSHCLPVGDEPPRREGQLQELRTAQGSHREAPDDVGTRHQPDHHQGADTRRGTDGEVQCHGEDAAGERLLRKLRRRRAEVRVKQPVEGLNEGFRGRPMRGRPARSAPGCRSEPFE
jgi:predicted Ser/Thr protein kinase